MLIIAWIVLVLTILGLILNIIGMIASKEASDRLRCLTALVNNILITLLALNVIGII